MSILHGLQRAAAAELLARREARRGLLAFTRYTMPGFQVNWHHVVLCGYLDRFARGEITRLAVFMPPRHTKSELVSRRLPAWLFGMNPDTSLIATSYSADLASRMNRDVQRIIDSPAYARLFPETKLAGMAGRGRSGTSAVRTQDLFEIVGRAGSYRSAGIGGGITGMGYRYGIIDDPLKDAAEAASMTIRNAQWDWYTSTFYTRQEPEAGILLTMTRWNIDDMAGRALAAVTGGEPWTVVRFPAIADGELMPEDPRQPGEALWPDRYPLDRLREIEASIGAYQFAALYQQTPVPAGGRLFNLAQPPEILDDAPACVQTVRFYDLAVTAKRSSDYTVGLKLGLLADETLVVLDVWRAQRELPDVHEWIVANAAQDGPATRIRLEAEKAGIVQLQFLLRDARMRPYTLDAVPPEGDKFTRAGPAAARWNAGRVKLVRGAWNRAFLDELATFPVGAHDDQVDALSGAYAMLSTKARTMGVGVTKWL